MWVWVCGCANEICMKLTGCGDGSVGVRVGVCLGVWLGEFEQEA